MQPEKMNLDETNMESTLDQGVLNVSNVQGITVMSLDFENIEELMQRIISGELKFAKLNTTTQSLTIFNH